MIMLFGISAFLLYDVGELADDRSRQVGNSIFPITNPRVRATHREDDFHQIKKPSYIEGLRPDRSNPADRSEACPAGIRIVFCLDIEGETWAAAARYSAASHGHRDVFVGYPTAMVRQDLRDVFPFLPLGVILGS